MTGRRAVRNLKPSILTAAVPLGEYGRIAEIDVIRGAALFGVLWMNLVEITTWLVPHPVRDALATAPVDRVAALLSTWLLDGKAQTLFGILFGFGFAVFIDRASARESAPARLFARRLVFLLLLGTLQYVFLWWGDILHDYALVGFALLPVRRWPARRLMVVGLALVLLAPLGSMVAASVIDGGSPHTMGAIRAQFHSAMWQATAGGHYIAMLHAIRLRSAAVYGDGAIVGYFALLFGQFLLGAFVFRAGWLQRAEVRRQVFRRMALVCFPAGLIIAGLDPAETVIGHAFLPLPGSALAVLEQAGTLMLAAGYAALTVLAASCLRLQPVCRGLAGVGRMALTNYVTQSVFYFIVIDGFGFGLIGRIGITLDGVAATLLFFAQALFSRWWLRRFRFGPLEWLWRSATYKCWQTLRAFSTARPSLSAD